MKTLVLLFLYSIDISGHRNLMVMEVATMAACYESRASIIKNTTTFSNGAPIENEFTKNLICQEINVMPNYEPEYYKVRNLTEAQK